MIESFRAPTNTHSAISKLIDEARKGCALVLQSSRFENRLSVRSLAMSAIAASVSPHTVIGTDSLSNNCALGIESLTPSEAALIFSGYSYEDLIKLAEVEFSHVFCGDISAAMLRGAGKRIFPTAKWTIVRDSISDKAMLGEAESELEKWIGIESFNCIQSVDLLDLVPQTTWIGAVDLTPLLGNSLVIYDESAEFPANAAFIEEELARCEPESHFILISAHAKEYSAVNDSSWIKRLTAILDSESLAIPVYCSLLRSASRYITPIRPPYGKSPLSLLRSGVEVITTKIPAESSPPMGVQVPETLELSKATWWDGLAKLLHNHPGLEKPEIEFSILTCCFKYLQRFRCFLNSVARQTYPLEKIEVCVALPGNPDGVKEYLELVQKAHPKLRIAIADVDETARANRGKMINEAFKISSGNVVMVADCDLILPGNFVARMLKEHQTDSVTGCWRTPLSPLVTAHILTGNLDAVEQFDNLYQQWDSDQSQGVREGVLGYCQVVERAVFSNVGYPEEFESINQSDIVFIERIVEKLQASPVLLKDLYVLHLAHERDWAGTKRFL